MIRETLLTGKAANARFITLYAGQATPASGEAACAASLAQVPRPFTTVMLGMGTDGHTASLFPGGDNLTHALADDAPPCLGINAPGAGEPRITLSLPVLRDTDHLILLCTGEEKRAVFQKARRTGPVEDMPIRAFLSPPAPRLHFYWAP
jgi:6-phosphogluconolactonase